MIKFYITAIESNSNGTAVTLFEDFVIGGFEDADEIEYSEHLAKNIARKIEEAKKEPIPF